MFSPTVAHLGMLPLMKPLLKILWYKLHTQCILQVYCNYGILLYRLTLLSLRCILPFALLVMTLFLLVSSRVDLSVSVSKTTN